MSQNWPGPRPRFRELVSGPLVVQPDTLLTEAVSLPDGRTIEWYFAGDGFWQVNRFLWPRWLGTMYGWLTEVKTDDQQWDAIELFCGSGLIGGYLTPHFQDYVGFESSRSAIKATKLNFKELGVRHRVQRADLYQAKIEWPANSNILIANPPRLGLTTKLISQIPQQIEWLLYSSCNPATLNRDLQALEQLGFAPKRTMGFDFFARTAHLEILLLLQRPL